jgi:hypothetical protein
MCVRTSGPACVARGLRRSGAVSRLRLGVRRAGPRKRSAVQILRAAPFGRAKPLLNYGVVSRIVAAGLGQCGYVHLAGRQPLGPGVARIVARRADNPRAVHAISARPWAVA